MVCTSVRMRPWNPAQQAKQPGHGCNSHSISCVQIGRSNNSIAAANSLMDEAQVQKSRIMQSRPSGNCCPKAISFNIGQTSIGITHQLNKSSHTSYLIFMPASFSLKYKVPHTHMGLREEVINDPGHNYFLAGMMMVGGRGILHGLASYSSSTSTPLSCLHKTGTDDKTEEKREMPEEIHGLPLKGPLTGYPALLFTAPDTSCAEHQGQVLI